MFRTILLSLVLLVFAFFSIKSALSEIAYARLSAPKTATFWEYQCVDTMKYSRDRARAFLQGAVKEAEIETQVKKIASFGANCISVGTPYDAEFVPYLAVWVKYARASNLKVWFRGNWSGYEGWFEYAPLASLDEHHAKTKQFIEANASLFRDGDIFTPSPEPENTKFFKPLFEKDSAVFRSFITQSRANAADAFKEIKRDVKTEFTSLSGGVATYMLNSDSVRALNSTVTLDHYVSDPKKMTEYIEKFHEQYNAKIVLGEFGAPIPDLNGVMSEDQQADFVDQLFHTLSVKREVVPAVNYWTLSDASTALLNPDGSERKVTEVLRKYYKPTVVYGMVTNPFGDGVKNARIVDASRNFVAYADKNGFFTIILPHSDEVSLQVNADGFHEQTVKMKVKVGGNKVRVRLW